MADLTSSSSVNMKFEMYFLYLKKENGIDVPKPSCSAIADIKLPNRVCQEKEKEWLD